MPIAYSVVLSAIAHQMWHSQVLSGYPHSSVGTYDGRPGRVYYVNDLSYLGKQRRRRVGGEGGAGSKHNRHMFFVLYSKVVSEEAS